MLKQRVVTAVVLLALLVGALAWSRTAVELLATLVLAVALGEWLQLVGWGRTIAIVGAVVFGGLLFAIALLTPSTVERAVLPLALIATATWMGLALVLIQPNAMAIRIPRAASTVLALAMTLAAWAALLHFLHEGVLLVLSVLIIVWLADTAAYFAGRAFGKRKLAPHISPGKTWAGVIGAAVVVVIAAWIAYWSAPEAPIWSNKLIAAFGVFAVAMLAFLVMLSVVGDLFESLLKRQAGVKDSSQLLPGHGGFYDRIDALLPVLPLAVVFEWMAH